MTTAKHCKHDVQDTPLRIRATYRPSHLPADAAEVTVSCGVLAVCVWCHEPFIRHDASYGFPQSLTPLVQAPLCD